MIRRDVFTASPPLGDYVLSPTGLTWGVRRTSGTGSLMSISAGERNRKSALMTLLALAEGDQVDAWEPAGNGSFRLVTRFRSSP